MLDPLIFMVVGVVTFTATALISDLKTRRIPNWLTVTAFALGVAFHTLTAGWSGLGLALGGFGAGFGLLLVLWLVGGGGGGDVKMMGALGAWLGAPLTLIVFVASGVLALFAVLGMYMWRMLARSTATAGGGSVANNRDQISAARRLIPYAIPVTIAAWAVMAAKLIAIYAR